MSDRCLVIFLGLNERNSISQKKRTVRPSPRPFRICGSTDHAIMLAGGVPLLSVGVLGFLCLCSYAAVKVPEWSAMEILSLLAQRVELGGIGA